MDMMQTLSQELSVPRGQIESAVRLMDEGNTIPFIARYRKEATGGLDDTVLRNLSERLSYLRNLEKRRQEVFALIEESGKLEGRELEQLRAALEGYTYHRTWGTILSDNSIDGPDEWVGYSLHLDAGGKSISSMGSGKVLINGCVYRVGYWGNQTDLAWMEEVCAVLGV